MLIIARTTCVQTVVMNGDSITHESYDCVLVGTGKQKNCLKTASDGADARRRGRPFQTVAPETGNARLPK